MKLESDDGLIHDDASGAGPWTTACERQYGELYWDDALWPVADDGAVLTTCLWCLGLYGRQRRQVPTPALQFGRLAARPH